MKIVKKYAVISALFCFLLFNNVGAKVIEFVENAYAMQAPKEIIAVTERVASLIGFSDGYEVISPKKPGIQVNPWNKFVSYGINPQTKNPFIIVNPQWFLTIPQGQQDFLLGRPFVVFQKVITSFAIKFLPYMFILLSIFLIIVFFLGLGRTRLANKKKWIRFLIALGIVSMCNVLFINKLQLKLSQYLGYQYDIKVNEKVLEKTLDRDVAIKALEFFDASIKAEFEKGGTFFAPSISLFKGYADQLKK